MFWDNNHHYSVCFAYVIFFKASINCIKCLPHSWCGSGSPKAHIQAGLKPRSFYSRSYFKSLKQWLLLRVQSLDCSVFLSALGSVRPESRKHAIPNMAEHHDLGGGGPVSCWANRALLCWRQPCRDSAIPDHHCQPAWSVLRISEQTHKFANGHHVDNSFKHNPTDYGCWPFLKNIIFQ